MAFDIIGAKKSGYTDPQIAQEMASKFGFDYQGARKAGFSDQQIIGEMLSKSDAGASPANPRTDQIAKGAKLTPQEQAQYEKNRADFIAANGGSAFGLANRGNQQDVQGIASPQGKVSAQNAREWLAARPRAEYLGQNLPETMVKNAVALPLQPVLAAKELLNSPDTAQTAKEIGKSLVKPLVDYTGINDVAHGDFSMPRTREAWMTDPAMGLMVTAPLVKPAARAALATAGKASEAAGKIRPMADPELVALSEQHNVPLTAGELAQKPGTKNIETQLERVPFVGTRGFREQQSNALAGAANKVVNKFEPESGVSDLPDAIQESMLTTLRRGKDSAKNAYDQVGQMVKSEGVDDTVTLPRLTEKAQNILNKYPDLFDRLPSAPIKNLLDTIVSNKPMQTPSGGASIAGVDSGYLGGTAKPKNFNDMMTGGGAKTPKGVSAVGGGATGAIDATGQGGYFLKPQSKISFQEAKLFREKLNNYLNRAYKSAGAVGDRELRALTELKRALDDDIQTWGENTGNQKVINAFQNANKVYQEQVAPFKDFLLKKATGNEFDTDMLIKTFIKGDRPQLAAKLMKSLDSQGQTLVKYAILKDALESGMDTKPGVPFSPAKFAGRLEKLGQTKNAIFSAKEQTMLDGFVKLSRAAERAGQFAENPPTGLRASDTGISMGIGAGLLHNPLGTVGGLTAVKVLSSLLTTPTGKSILLRASRTPVASKAWSQILSDMKDALATSTAGMKLQEQYGKLRNKKGPE